MTAHSLILSPHEVRAALDETLGLVVRPVKPQPTTTLMGHEGEVWHRVGEGKYQSGLPDKCPLGVPGDRLRCKETYYIHNALGRHRSDGLRWGPWGGLPTTISPDGEYIAYYKAGFDRCAPMWRSPATMPRWASRITLEVEGVRCVLVQELTEDDAKVAGMTGECPIGHIPSYQSAPFTYHFAQEWENRYGKKYPWDSNPWVWAVKVKRVAA